MLNPARQSALVFRRWAIALALLLLLGQFLALTHQHSADHSSTDGCALCQYAQQTSGFLPSVIPLLPLTVFLLGNFILLAQTAEPASVRTVRTRAPPHIAH